MIIRVVLMNLSCINFITVDRIEDIQNKRLLDDNNFRNFEILRIR